MQQQQPFDVVVVGAGACGGLAGKLLAESGLRVALLEAGSRIDDNELLRRYRTIGQQCTADEPFARDRQPIQSTCFAYNLATRDLFVDDVDNPYSIDGHWPFHWIRLRGVGGRTQLWSRFVYRMSDREFGERHAEDDYGGWPLDYSDLARYYDLIEDYMGIYGELDSCADVPDGRFLKPPPLTSTEQQFKRAVEALWPERRVIRSRYVGVTGSRVAPDRSPTAWFCSGASTIRDGLRTGRLHLRENTVVSSVLRSPETRLAEGVSTVDSVSGQTDKVHARVVMLCASTLESTRILLNSGPEKGKESFANSSGSLGRFLMDSVRGVEMRATKEGKFSGYEDTGLFIPGFRSKSPASEDYRGAFGVQVWVGWRAGPNRIGCSAVSFGSMVPRRTNRVILNRNVTDAWGIPTLSISCKFSENEVRLSRHQQSVTQALLHAAGFRDPRPAASGELAPPGSSIHEVGTARMGRHPEGSVLDPRNRCWDVPNLYVTDGACFPSLGQQHPTLTMMALTARACDDIVRRCRVGEL